MDSQLASFGSEPIRHFWGPKTVKLTPVGTEMPGRVRARASRLLMWNHNSFEMRPSLAPSETCQKPLFHPCVAFQQLFTYPVHTT